MGAAELLKERAMTEPDIELAEAMLKGAHALQKDYEWVEGDLRDWLTNDPWLDEVNLGC